MRPGLRWSELAAPFAQPLDSFLDAWAAVGGSDGVRQREQVRRALTLDGDWDRALLKTTLRLVLARGEGEGARFDRFFDTFFLEVERDPRLVHRVAEALPEILDELRRPLATSGVREDRPHVSVQSWLLALEEPEGGTLTADEDGATTEPVRRSDLPPPPERRAAPEPAPVTAPAARGDVTAARAGATAEKSASSAEPVPTLGAAREPDEPTLELEHDELELNYEATRSPVPLSQTELDRLAYGVGASRCADRRALDLRRTIARAARQGGALIPVWREGWSVRAIRLIADPDLDPVAEALVCCFAEGLRQRGVQIHREALLPAGPIGDDLLIRVTDLSAHDRVSLRALRHYPHLRVVEARDPALWGSDREGWPDEVHTLDFVGLRDALEGMRRARPGASLGPVGLGLDLLGDTLPLAAACALVAPCDLATADVLRWKLCPELPFLRIQRILRLRGLTRDPSGWRFDRSLVGALVRRVDDDFRRDVLRWSLERLERIVVRPGGPLEPALIEDRSLLSAWIALGLSGAAASDGAGAPEEAILGELRAQLADSRARRRLEERVALADGWLPPLKMRTGVGMRSALALGLRAELREVPAVEERKELPPEEEPPPPMESELSSAAKEPEPGPPGLVVETRVRAIRQVATAPLAGVDSEEAHPARAEDRHSYIGDFGGLSGGRGKAIGIDLGTSNSCAAIMEMGRPRVLTYKGGATTIPSVFAIDEKGQRLVGHEAKKQAQLNPCNTVMAAKRLIGRNFHSKTIEKIRQVFTYELLAGDNSEVLIKVKDQVFTLEQISAEILRKIKEVAEEALSAEVGQAVITVPSYYNDRQRQAVRNAGRLAGLKVLRILNESTAAALAYGLGKNLSQRVAVYDFGGGVFNVTVVDIKDRIFEVIATGGDTFLGGVDLDERIMQWVLEQFLNTHDIDLVYDRVAMMRIRDAAEQAKIELSTITATRLHIPHIAKTDQGVVDIDLDLSRAQLEALTRDLVDRTIMTLERILKEAGSSKDEVNEILLVGAQSRMPLVQRAVTEWMGRPPCKGVHPDEAVAIGAAILAGCDVALLDVLPMPIGINKVDGSMHVLFQKNQPLPDYKTRTLTTGKDNQRSIMLRIYQGESRMGADNELLGTFDFKGIRPAPKGQVQVEVTFNIDSEGIINLTARDKETGEFIIWTLRHDVKELKEATQKTIEQDGLAFIDAPLRRRGFTASAQPDAPGPPHIRALGGIMVTVPPKPPAPPGLFARLTEAVRKLFGD